MSTRSMILKEVEPGKYEGIYCHSDGYLTYNGAMLLDHYQTRDKVEKLLALGDLSILAEKIEPDPSKTHNFDERQYDVCVAYGRDRGESNTESKPRDLKEIDDPRSWIAYCYIYGLDDTWRYFSCGHLNEGIKDLFEGVVEEYRQMGFPRPQGLYGYFTDEEIERFRKLEHDRQQKELEAE